MEFSTLSGLIGAIISVVFALILVLPILMGALRGVKKTAFRLAWVIVFGVVGFAFMGLISNAIINLDITSFNLQVDGTVATSIPHYLELTISASNPDLAQLIADNPEVFTSILAMVVSVINMFIFVIWFWLTKWLLWPVWALVSHFIFKNKKTVSSKIVKDGHVVGEKQTVVKQKKYAWAGALIGLAMGVLTLMFTAIPFAGITDTITRIEQQTMAVQEDGSEKGLISANLGENADIIYVYANSPAGVVLSSVGINQVSTAIAKTMTTTTSNGVSTSALDEIVNFATLTNDAQVLANTDFQNLTKQGWADTLPAIKKVSSTVLSSGIVKTCYESLVPYVIDNMLTNPDYFIQLPDLGDDVLNRMFKEVLQQVKTISVDDIKNDLLVAIEMCEEVNNNNILTELVKGDVTTDFLKENITTELGTTLNEKLFDMQAVGKILPVCLDGAVEYLCGQLDVTYVASDSTLTAEQTEQFFDSLVTDAIAILKGYDDTQNLPFASTTFENLGDVVDALKASGIVSTQTFNNLVDYATYEIDIILQDANLKPEINTLLQDVLADIKYIPSYKNELRQIGLAYQVVLDEEIDVENLELKQATKVLDKVLTTFVYQHNIQAVETCVADLVNEYCQDGEIGVSQNTINTICGDISSVYSFELEYTKIEGLVEYLQQILEQGDFESHLKNSETMSTLGSHLDSTVASQSVLLNDQNCKLILKDIIQNVQLPEDLQGTVINGQDILVVMANNADKITSYQTEFTHIANILSIDGTLSLTQYGKALDGVKQSVLLDGVLVQVVTNKINEKADLVDDQQIADIVKDVTQNISDSISYEQEFGYLDAVANFDTENATMAEFGALLDNLVDSQLFNGSTNDILLYALDKGKDDVDAVYHDVYGDITNNVQNISGKIYAQELAYVQSFVDFTNNGEPKTKDNIQAYLNNNLLNADGTSKSVLIDTEITNKILELAVI